MVMNFYHPANNDQKVTQLNHQVNNNNNDNNKKFLYYRQHEIIKLDENELLQAHLPRQRIFSLTVQLV